MLRFYLGVTSIRTQSGCSSRTWDALAQLPTASHAYKLSLLQERLHHINDAATHRGKSRGKVFAGTLGEVHKFALQN